MSLFFNQPMNQSSGLKLLKITLNILNQTNRVFQYFLSLYDKDKALKVFPQ